MTSNPVVERPLFIYLQRPDNGEWVTVGRYRPASPNSPPSFRYADSYCDSQFSWSIDPVNLPFIPVVEVAAQRYGGLHDVLRDASPDAWGQMLLKRQHGLGSNATALTYLTFSGNADRWGALAVGRSKSPNVAKLSSPKLAQLSELVKELIAVSESRPPINATLRKRLFASPSMGGARPKTTIQDGETYWLVKPGLITDTVDLARLEHATQCLGNYAGMRFAETCHHELIGGRSVVRIRRFDRQGNQRILSVSAASILQVQYPPISDADSTGSSYPRLAEELKRIGVPDVDRIELFERMVFNAIIGNDDDHARNHAVIYDHTKGQWRLSPAFDVVPNPDECPTTLTMQVCSGSTAISRETLTRDYLKFGFASIDAASVHLDEFLMRVVKSFDLVEPLLGESLADLMRMRIDHNSRILSAPFEPARKNSKKM